VTSVSRQPFAVTSFDNTTLDAVAYVPHTTASLPNGTSARFPVLMFLHGWGESKEVYEGAAASPLAGTPAQGSPADGVNRLHDFAIAGFISVAYDARGFGASGGQATVAGPAEQKDFSVVLDRVLKAFQATGFVGVVGQSYGAGEGLLAWPTSRASGRRCSSTVGPTCTRASCPATSRSLSGPKRSTVRHDWQQGPVFADDPRLARRRPYAARACDRASPDGRAQCLGTASLRRQTLFLCQGMQESLFPQIDDIWGGAGGFTRAYVSVGGHGATMRAAGTDPGMGQFFLQGFDTHVDSWPALATPDALGGDGAEYAVFPRPRPSAVPARAGPVAGCKVERHLHHQAARSGESPSGARRSVGSLGPSHEPCPTN